eukprot:9019312-Karenia_brevis.AAC.1
MKKDRAKRGLATPCLMRFRLTLRVKTYKRGQAETRGRKRIYSRAWVDKLNKTRKHLTKRAAGEREVRWEDVRRSARAPKGHRSTLLRSFQREGIPVQARRPRQKPDRTKDLHVNMWRANVAIRFDTRCDTDFHFACHNK